MIIPDLVKNGNKIRQRETFGQFRSDGGHCKAGRVELSGIQRPAKILQMDERTFYGKDVSVSLEKR